MTKIITPRRRMLAALRQSGADQFDPVRLYYLQAPKKAAEGASSKTLKTRRVRSR